MGGSRGTGEQGPGSGVRGAILAGGAASRFDGGAKGLALVDGRRILDRLVRVFEVGLGALPLLVANAPDAQAWYPGLRVVPDARPGCGALGGLYTAIIESPAPVVCVAWDMPFVPPSLLRALVETLPGHDAVLPESDGPLGMEPLCAAYGPGCQIAIERCLNTEDLRATAFHADIRLGLLPANTVKLFGDPAHMFFNVNTPADLTVANQLRRT